MSPGNIYAVTAGDYMGEFFLFMEELEDYIFLSLPDFHIRTVPRDKYKFAIENNILDFRERLPKNIFNDCITKYNQIKSDNPE